MLTSSLDILEKSQLSSPQAKAILQVMELELSVKDEVLATKADLSAFRSDLEVRMARLETRLELQIQSVKTEVARWILTAVIGQTTVMLGAFYFFLNYARK